jgi:hypothetical protein
MDFLDFEERVNEVNQYIEFVFVVDKLSNIAINSKIADLNSKDVLDELKLSHLFNIDTYNIDDNLKKTLKANVFLLLYNLIEGAVTSGIDAIFLSINSSGLKVRELNNQFRKIYFEYKSSDFSHTNKSKKEVYDYFNHLSACSYLVCIKRAKVDV